MKKFLTKRFLSLIPTILIITILVFGLVSSLPGDPTAQYLGPNAQSSSPEQIEKQREEVRRRLGLDQPIPVRYAKWMQNTFIKGDFGTSLTYNKEVKKMLPYYIANSFILNIAAFIITYLISIPLGILSSVKKGQLFDRFWQVFSVFGISLPTFLLSLLLIFIFGIKLELFPISGMQTAGYTHLNIFDFIGDVSYYMVLPVTVLVINRLASTIRYIRNAMVEVIKQDYIRTARSKGLSEKVVIYSHAFRNALIPVVTLVFLDLPLLFAGSVVIENIFKWPGVGSILIESINKQDNALIIAITVFYALLSITANVLMDISYAVVDPRVRL
ncbi:MAG: ABC transporter permease [Bacilli bacterium]